MGMVSVKNDGKNDMVVAGCVIVAGETRHFDESLVPSTLRPEAAASVQEPTTESPDPLRQLRGQSVSTIKEALPTLEERHLVALCRLEERTENPRSTLLAAIGEEQLRRASEIQPNGGASKLPSGQQEV